ncbi:AAA family ATPase [Brevibacterium sp. ZH18]|uniref:AAA family ATPase n=1 Tax=Brevibacterium sp. ZH18 TaxID=2927784 RepID=UPI001F60C2FC|nr:AAA family ATPase [Brevibacterium sp. ZH18]MCI4011674.1 ATP-binding protein [Brevibacterium sp. ZH18]
MEQKKERPNRSIKSPVVSVESNTVLGEFNYRLQFDGSHPLKDRMLLIYAENGMGKTNFLKTVYHLLSPRLESLQALADLHVDEMKISLESGATISLSEASDADALFSCQLQIPQEFDDDLLVEVTVRQEDIDSRAFRRASRRHDIYKYLNTLEEIVNPAVFVGDDRLIHSSSESSPPYRSSSPNENRHWTVDKPQIPGQSLRDSLDAVGREFMNQYIRTVSKDSTRAGEGVYVEITKRVLEGNAQKLLAADARRSLLDQVESLLEEAPIYETYGLVSFNQVRRIKQMIDETRVNHQTFRPLHGIIEPYLSSMRDKIDTLVDTQELIDTFVSSVNSFLERKELRFSISEGIRLRGRNQEEIDPDGLSSGEKHLLLLLSHSVLARQAGSLVIIDEPELSLGLRWQRKLLSELLRCTEGSGVRFLMASHSVQIMGDLDDVMRPTEAW